MRSRSFIGLTIALCAGVGCRPSAEPEPAEPSVSATAEGVGESDEAETGAQELFGMPVPDGAELDESGDSFAHYNVPGSYEEVVAEYRDALTGYRVVEYDEGVKFEPRDGTGRSLYVLQGEDDGVMVTYFNEEVAVASNAVADSPTDATRVGGVPGTPEADGTAGTSTAGANQVGSSATGNSRGQTGGNQTGSSGVGSEGNVGAVDRRVQPRSNAPERGTTNPLGRRPINFTGVFEPPRNPNAYY